MSSFTQSSVRDVERYIVPSATGFEDILPGPLKDRDWRTVRREMMQALVNGDFHLLLADWTEQYNPAGNIAVPAARFGWGQEPRREPMIICGDPDDCMRLLRIHVNKAPTYHTSFLGEGVLAHIEKAEWQRQRHHLAEAFLPFSSLARIAPLVRQEAEAICDRLAAYQGAPFEISEELLHTAFMALGRGLFGEDEEYLAERSLPLRSAFLADFGVRTKESARQLKMDQQRLWGGLKHKDFIDLVTSEFVARAEERGTIACPGSAPPLAAPGDVPVRSGGCPVRGPLMARLATVDKGWAAKQAVGTAEDARRDSTATLLFAGHDTTGNTMTWCLFELARHPDIQRRVREEVDQVFDSLNGRQMEYADLFKFKFLTKVIMETLRLWPIVVSGTFREAMVDDDVAGADGRRVPIPKGTLMQFPVWTFHHSPALWGEDVLQFNPDRAWRDEEIWSEAGLSGRNPETTRFMPFTHTPRDCLGKNFAQMEMRLVIPHILRRFELSLAEPTVSDVARAEAAGDVFRGMSFVQGVLRPRNGIHVVAKERAVPARARL